MKKKIVLALFGILLTILLSNTKVFTNSSGAEVGYTGAPSDGNCTSCHSGSALNSSPGTLKLSLLDSLGDTATSYKPGAKYSFIVAANYSGRSTFGFEATVREKSNNSAIGTIITATGVQYCYGFSGYNKNYITHTYYSNTGTNGKKWTSSWVAPTADVGNIVFYAAANAANGDASDRGDKIYTASLNLPYSSTTGIIPAVAVRFTTIYPNPCIDDIHIHYSFALSAQATISLINTEGKTIETIADPNREPGEHELNMSLSGILRGIYFLKLESNGKADYVKILKE